MKESNEAILVAARIRPPAERVVTRGLDETVIEAKSGSTIRVKNGSEYVYDKVFAMDCDQDTVFESIGKRIADGCLGGYNGTIFAYGQTGSGKTYTMLGPPGGQDVFDAQPHLRGLIPRIVEYLFRQLNEKSDQLGALFTYAMKCTFAQLYNENFYDLLSGDSRRVTPRASKNGTIYLAGATERPVLSTDDFIQLLHRGLTNRHVAETAMNQESSRSHAVFTLELITTLVEGGIVNVRRSILNLVDLAGSERQRDTETSSKSRVKEACSINSSLLILGRVIRELADVDHRKDTYVPYRDSGLTYLLKDSLGGNARAAFIVTVHPNKRFAEETISALRFACDVKKVKNVASVNEDLSGENVDALKAEIIRLKDQLRRQPKITDEDLTRLQEEVALWRTKAKSWEDVAQVKDIELYQCKGQLRMRDFSIRIFHETNASIDVKQAILTWQQEFDNLMRDYGNERIHRKGDLTDLDVYQLSDRAEKAEEEVMRLRERVQQLELEKEQSERRRSQIREQFDDVERRVSLLMSPVGPLNSSPRKSAARARRERRMTRFTLSPSRCIQPPVGCSSETSLPQNGAFESEEGECSSQNIIKELSEQLRAEQGATLRADVYANQLEQQLDDREELLRRYEKEENEKLVSFAIKVESLETEKSALSSEVSALREQLAKLEPVNAEMHCEVVEGRQRIVELAKERDSLLAKERELNADLRRKNILLHESKERIDMLSARLEAYAACEGDLRKVNAELKEEKEGVSQEFDSLKLEKAVLLRETVEVKQKLLECSRELSDVREQLKMSEEKLRESSAAHIHNAESLERKDRRIGELEAKISTLYSEREKEKDETKRVIMKENSRVEKVEREFAALVEAVMNVEVDVVPGKSRRSCFGDAIGRVNKLADTMHRMRKQLDTLQEERDTLAAHKEEIAVEMEKLKEEYELAEQELKAMMSNAKLKSGINVLERYRQKYFALKEENEKLLNESDVLRKMLYSSTDASLRSPATSACSNSSAVRKIEQRCQAVPLDPTREQKENIASKQRRRRVAKVKR